MKRLFFFMPGMVLLFGCAQSNSQKSAVKSKTVNSKTENPVKIGGGCEGCAVIYQSPIPFDQLSWVDTLPDFHEAGTRIVISGVIYQSDGVTPAKDVVLYVYHTDQTGRYTNRNKEEGYAGRQGYIKGWVKTNEKGEYKLYTLRPVSYPNSKIPAHIHPVIREPNKNEYWIDEFLFDDDPFLTGEERKKQEGRGGNGILKLEKRDGIYHCIRDIYLGRNVPDYPKS
jgi:protocatechuate 3,4-dioxygenase beta subunit